MSKYILVVDDDVMIRRVVERILTNEGYRVVTLGDSQKVIAQIETELPALIISDLSMPNMSGVEIIKAVKREPRFVDIPIVVLTANASKIYNQEALQAGAKRIIFKPFSKTDISDVADEFLHTP